MPSLLDILLGEPREGKLGLALSGGGFRAAFFHLGVLARLAEVGLLPRVEVISTVSGGSIVGALYYLRLRCLLEEKPDERLLADDYVELVADVERRLRDGVQKNIRARVFANLAKNVRMAVLPSYSRSDRIGDLYDRHFYKDAWGTPRPERSWNRERQVEMRELPIAPAGDPCFVFPDGNEGRRAKVPALLVNATSLNSGHNWRFEAIRMGESSPEDRAQKKIVGAVDKNMQLEPGYFDPGPNEEGVPARQLDFPLGIAVAASAGVPGVFQPLAVTGMYEDVRVQLVDGGVQDNQGVQGLFDKGCTELIVSDASGQMDDDFTPSPLIPGVLGRTVSIEGDRIRDMQLTRALNRPFRRHALMHLRKGLQARQIAPIPPPGKTAPPPPPAKKTTGFGVHVDVQWALSKIRTDLDYFSDVEASALELDGYLMSRSELASGGLAKPEAGETRPQDRGKKWAFEEDEQLVKGVATGAPGVVHRLRAGRKRSLRLLALAPELKLMAMILATVALAFGVGPAVDWLGGALTSHWPVWPVVTGVAVVAVPVALYAIGPRGPFGVLLAVAMGAFLVLASPLLWLWANLSVATSRRYEV